MLHCEMTPAFVNLVRDMEAELEKAGFVVRIDMRGDPARAVTC
jgi:hypothetical protein